MTSAQTLLRRTAVGAAALLLSSAFVSTPVAEYAATGVWLAIVLSSAILIIATFGRQATPSSTPLRTFVTRLRTRLSRVKRHHTTSIATYERNDYSNDGSDGIVRELVSRLEPTSRRFFTCGPCIDGDAIGLYFTETSAWTGTSVDTTHGEQAAIARLDAFSPDPFGFVRIRTAIGSVLYLRTLECNATIVALSPVAGGVVAPWTARSLRQARKDFDVRGFRFCGTDSRARVAYFVTKKIARCTGFTPDYVDVLSWSRG